MMHHEQEMFHLQHPSSSHWHPLCIQQQVLLILWNLYQQCTQLYSAANVSSTVLLWSRGPTSSTTILTKSNHLNQADLKSK